MKSLPAVLLLGLLAMACTPVEPVGDPLILVERDDPQIAAATRGARRSLDRMLAYIAEDPSRVADAGLKVALPMIAQDADEHIWVTPFAQIGPERFTGLLANRPTALGPLRLGDPVAFRKEQISDWFVVIGGVEYGSFTTRALLPAIPEPDASRIRRRLAPSPLPAEWR